MTMVRALKHTRFISASLKDRIETECTTFLFNKMCRTFCYENSILMTEATFFVTSWKVEQLRYALHKNTIQFVNPVVLPFLEIWMQRHTTRTHACARVFVRITRITGDRVWKLICKHSSSIMKLTAEKWCCKPKWITVINKHMCIRRIE